MTRKTTTAVVTLAAAAALALAPTAAFAGGSDDPTPYSVTVDGVTLPDGQTFRDGGHINIRTTANVAYGLHFEDRNWPEDHPKRAYIGESFIPWSAFGIPEGQACIQWVQLAEFNEHFGEGGQTPVGPDCAAPSDPEDPKTTPTDPPVTEQPEPTPEPTEAPTPEPTEEPTPDPTAAPTPEPTRTPTEPLEPAGGDMRPALIGGAALMLTAGIGTLLAAARTKRAQR